MQQVYFFLVCTLALIVSNGFQPTRTRIPHRSSGAPTSLNNIIIVHRKQYDSRVWLTPDNNNKLDVSHENSKREEKPANALGILRIKIIAILKQFISYLFQLYHRYFQHYPSNKFTVNSSLEQTLVVPPAQETSSKKLSKFEEMVQLFADNDNCNNNTNHNNGTNISTTENKDYHNTFSNLPIRSLHDLPIAPPGTEPYDTIEFFIENTDLIISSDALMLGAESYKTYRNGEEDDEEEEDANDVEDRLQALEKKILSVRKMISTPFDQHYEHEHDYEYDSRARRWLFAQNNVSPPTSSVASSSSSPSPATALPLRASLLTPSNNKLPYTRPVAVHNNNKEEADVAQQQQQEQLPMRMYRKQSDTMLTTNKSSSIQSLEASGVIAYLLTELGCWSLYPLLIKLLVPPPVISTNNIKIMSLQTLEDRMITHNQYTVCL